MTMAWVWRPGRRSYRSLPVRVWLMRGVCMVSGCDGSRRRSAAQRDERGVEQQAKRKVKEKTRDGETKQKERNNKKTKTTKGGNTWQAMHTTKNNNGSTIGKGGIEWGWMKNETTQQKFKKQGGDNSRCSLSPSLPN